MPAYAAMLEVTYYAQNYASIICQCLTIAYKKISWSVAKTNRQTYAIYTVINVNRKATGTQNMNKTHKKCPKAYQSKKLFKNSKILASYLHKTQIIC